MECTLAALLACFSWSNLYLDADLIAFDHMPIRQEWREGTVRQNGVVETYGQYQWTEHADNPYASVGFGYQLSFKQVTFAAEAAHISSVSSSEDRGLNLIRLRARWFPFR